MKLNTKALKKNKVGLAILFGSRITKTTHPKSDFDIGIVFENELRQTKKPLELYSDLYGYFSRFFKTKNPDIVYLREMPLSLQFKAINEGKIIYKSSGKFLADYREEVMTKYFDFQFVENYFNKVFAGKRL